MSYFFCLSPPLVRRLLWCVSSFAVPPCSRCVKRGLSFARNQMIFAEFLSPWCLGPPLRLCALGDDADLACFGCERWGKLILKSLNEFVGVNPSVVRSPSDGFLFSSILLIFQSPSCLSPNGWVCGVCGSIDLIYFFTPACLPWCVETHQRGKARMFPSSGGVLRRPTRKVPCVQGVMRGAAAAHRG